jgi:hypothetical protein
MNNSLKPPIAPRRTEDVARETLRGLVEQLHHLQLSDDPRAWDRIQEIGREITCVGETVAREMRRRRMAVAFSVDVVVAVQCPVLVTRGL